AAAPAPPARAPHGTRRRDDRPSTAGYAVRARDVAPGRAWAAWRFARASVPGASARGRVRAGSAPARSRTPPFASPLERLEHLRDDAVHVAATERHDEIAAVGQLRSPLGCLLPIREVVHPGRVGETLGYECSGHARDR